MTKKKSKKKKKGKSIKYKSFVILGALFHIIVYSLYYKTLYNDTLFWFSAGLCGLFFGIFFIKKMDLLNPKSYGKIDGFKLKLYMSIICVIMVVGGIAIFGSVINGTILGLNYIGKHNKSDSSEYIIQRVVKNRTRTRSGTRTISRKTVPRVYFKKNEEVIGLNLEEIYNPKKDYSEYRVIELKTYKGLLGFEIVNDYKLKK